MTIKSRSSKSRSSKSRSNKSRKSNKSRSSKSGIRSKVTKMTKITKLTKALYELKFSRDDAYLDNLRKVLDILKNLKPKRREDEFMYETVIAIAKKKNIKFPSDYTENDWNFIENYINPLYDDKNIVEIHHYLTKKYI